MTEPETRGDGPPDGAGKSRPFPSGFRCAVELPKDGYCTRLPSRPSVKKKRRKKVVECHRL